MAIRRPRRGHIRRVSSDSKPQEQDSTSLVSFLSVLQENKVTLLPISPHKGLRIIGRGLSGLIQQSSADIVTDFAFKHGIPSGLARDSKKDRDWQNLITEVRILQHPPIRNNPHVADLVGVSFYVDSSTATPVLVTLKANRGDLFSFLSNGDKILADDRICIQLITELAEAIHLLHGCGVAHGDIKPENVLIELSEEGIINCLLTDFGSSVVQGQKRLPSSSEPWIAHEVQTSSDPADFEFLRQADLFSFGLVCMHILIPLPDLERANLCLIWHTNHAKNRWAQLREQETLQEIILSLVEFVNISTKRKELLKNIIKATLQQQPGNRQMPWAELLPHIKEYLSEGHKSAFDQLSTRASDASVHSEHVEFDLSGMLGELDDTDYIVRRSIAQDLLYKAVHTECSLCRQRCAFWVAICYSLAFGVPRDPEAVQQWLDKSGSSDKDLRAVIEHIDNKYRVPGHVSKDVLDQLGLRMLVSANRIQEYQASSRILEAEAFLRQEIDARSEALGSNHRGLATLSSELARVLASRSLFSEAEQRQKQVVEILGLYFGDRHPRPLLAKIDLAQIFADRLRLKKAELLYEAAIPTLQDIVGAENADVASALQNFANLRVSLGKLQKAVTTMKQVVSIRSKQLPVIHPATIRAELNLIVITRLQGDTKHAAILMKQLEDRVQSSLSEDDILKASINIIKSAIRIDLNKLVQAEADIGRALGLMDRLQLSQSDSLRIEALSILASVHGANRKFTEQENVLRHILQQAIDEHNLWYLMNKICLAENLLEQGRYPEACNIATEVTSSEAGLNMDTPREVLAGHQILVNAASRQGDKRKALQIQQQCLDSCQRNLGVENDFTLEARYFHALSFEDLGDYREAQLKAEELLHYLQISNRLTSWRKSCHVARLLGRVCLSQSKFDDAERYCKDGLHWASEMLGEDHFMTIALHHVLAFTYLSKGKDAEAEAVLSDRFLEQVKGSETEIYVLKDLAILKKHQGRNSEAHDLSIRALNLCCSILGESHPESLDLLGDVLLTELDRRWSAEVETLVLGNIEAKKQGMGNSHRSTIKSMVNLAAAYGGARQFDKAERLIEEVKAIHIGTELQDPARHANNLARTAEIYFNMGRFDEAEELEIQALHVRTAIFGEDHEYVASTMNNLATTLHRKGQLQRAEELLQHVLRVREPYMLATKKSTLSYLRTKVTLAATIFEQSKGQELNLGRIQECSGMYAQVLEVAERECMPVNLVSHWRSALEAVDGILRDRQDRSAGT